VIVLGVDPGAQGTGLAVIDASRHGMGPSGRFDAPILLASETVRRTDTNPTTQPDPAYLVHVHAAIEAAVDRHRVDLLAVEGITEPNPHLGLTNTGAIIAASMVFGAVTSRGYGCRLVIIRPGKNGSRPLGWYPDALVSDRERVAVGPSYAPWRTRTAGRGALKDQRSAYDVAVTAHQLGTLATITGHPYTY